MSSEPFIRLQNVVVHRGSFCLKIQELCVNQGESIGIIAPSGRGKSTLLMLLAGLLPASEGEILVRGVDPFAQTARWRARQVAWLGSTLELPEDLLVHEQLKLAAHLIPQTPPTSDSISATLSHLGLDGFEKRTMASLSTGQQQRVALGRVLLHPSSLRLADEPTAALDEGWSDRCGDLLLDRTHRPTVCFASHDAQLITKADRVITPEGEPA